MIDGRRRRDGFDWFSGVDDASLIFLMNGF